MEFLVSQEERILKFWREKNIFKKSVDQRKKNKNFVFFEGPPTANGKPGIHHVLSRSFKDLIPRYKTMKGYKVIRRAGWDTHGLPVELEIEKKMGFKNKKDIESFGIEKFNDLCKKSVWEYKKEWERLTERMGFWVDMENAYITYETKYLEALFWIIKQIWERGCLEKSYKVVAYCPRCGTPLSSHEVAQGYKTVKEPALYVKFKINDPKFKKDNTFLLAWTTTPWTLPGNVALAINPQADYLIIKKENERFVLAEKRKELLKEGEVEEKIKGEKLLGLRYQPLFCYFEEIKPENIENAFKIYPADFVSLEEGTGIVHTAVMYGEEDFELGKQFNLPFYHLVDEEGRFKKEAKDWQGLFVKEADPLIINYLKEKNLLFKEELYEHEYPFCWRCKTPLLYYAKKTWFATIKKLKKDLIKNNQEINWIPSYLKWGRFGEWLKEIKDWALSRERYWGAPLPIWQCQKCGQIKVLGSLKEIVSQKYTVNNYLFLRHGEVAKKDKEQIYSERENFSLGLNEKEKKDIFNLAKKLKKQKIDFIFSSDYQRTKETAEIVAKELQKEIIFDKRLRDVNLGEYWGKGKKDFYQKFFNNYLRFFKKPQNGESGKEVLKRILDFIQEIEKKYQGKNILIVSHGDVIWWLDSYCRGRLGKNFFLREDKPHFIKKGELRKINIVPFPYNKNFEPDLHRPYIDRLKFFCFNCKGEMIREKEVIDCWFDSGAMPFAQYHYPFENKNLIDKKIQFPADYIAEGIDQTRGWFYTLLAVATLLGRGKPYKNVISLGHILDEKGEKMSKSKGNIVDPWYIINKYGIDPTRWYFYSFNQPYEPKCFSEKDIQEGIKKFILIYWNCYQFLQTYVSQAQLKKYPPSQSKNVLDKWILSALEITKKETTNFLEKYDIFKASKTLEDFIVNDLSLWYIRRSRKRFQKNPDLKDKKYASSVLSYVLLETAKMTAPLIPFLSETIYQGLKKIIKEIKLKESIHLEDWPKENKSLINRQLEKQMEKARQIVSLGLRARATNKIKVRQPLLGAKINTPLKKEILEIIKDELNIKELLVRKIIKTERNEVLEREENLLLSLNIQITPELKEEGILREILRNIQELRGELKLKPQNKVIIFVKGDSELLNLMKEKKDLILEEAIALDIKEKEKFQPFKELLIDNKKLILGIKKIS